MVTKKRQKYFRMGWEGGLPVYVNIFLYPPLVSHQEQINNSRKPENVLKIDALCEISFEIIIGGSPTKARLKDLPFFNIKSYSIDSKALKGNVGKSGKRQ